MQLALNCKLSTSVSSCLAPPRTWTALRQLEPSRPWSAATLPYHSTASWGLITRAAKSPKPTERSPEVQQQVERSAAKLQALLQSIAQTSRVLKSAQGDELVQQAVAEVLPELDEGFLAIAAAYAKSAKDAGNEELADLIDEVRSEVVRQVTRRLPVELQILNISTQISDREDRHNLLQQSMAEGVEGMIPACLPSSLWLTATQSITDMEEKESVPDRRLLAMLCLVREELRELAARLPQEDPELAAAVQNRGALLAPAALAFLQRIMAVPEPLQRKGLLTAALRREKAIDQDRSVKANQLMLAVNAVLAELESRAPIMDTRTGEMLYYGTEQEELEMSQRRLRLRSIRLETLQAISMSAGLSKASEQYQPLDPL